MATAGVAFVSPPCSPRGPDEGEGEGLLFGREFESVNPFLVVLDEGGEFPTIAATAAQAAVELGAARHHGPDAPALALGVAPRGHGPVPAVQPSQAPAAVVVDRLEPVARAARVYCQGDLLSAVQTAGVFEDCKEFVDMPLRHDPEAVLQAFQAIPQPLRRDPHVLRAFLAQHFHPPGADLVPHVPEDHTDEPALLGACWVLVTMSRPQSPQPTHLPTQNKTHQTATLAGHGEYRRWAAELNQFWKQLTRRVHADVEAHPQRYSILRRAHPVVVPGGRFRESYYWDSYWIVLGLLACDMKDTARGLVQNLLDDVADFGFVPNGGRVYYLNRSQPPLLSEMLLALVEHDPAGADLAFVQRALGLLEAEHRFWMAEGEHAVAVAGRDGQRHVLNRYYTASNHPRPESFREDLQHAGQADCATSFYADIAAGAESGWDFSSRWIRPAAATAGPEPEPLPLPHYPLERIATTAVLPVDLNTYLYRMERNMARLHDYLLARQTQQQPPQQQPLAATLLPPDSRASFVAPKAHLFAEASARRALAMEQLLWDPESGAWTDHWLGSTSTGKPTGGNGGRGREDVRPASNFAPLWGRVLDNPALAPVAAARKAQAVAALKASGLLQVGGVQTTAVDTVQQWDGANVWAPLVHMVVDGLEGVGSPEAAEMARSLAKAWLESNYLGWANTGQMHEKYNARLPGARGEGGEYLPQVGFGWTNGVVLHFLKTYGPSLLASGPPAQGAAMK